MIQTEKNINPLNPQDWDDYFDGPKKVVSGTTLALRAPARRGVRGIVDNWNGMDGEHRIQTVAMVAVLGVIGVEASVIAKDIIGPGAENVRRGIEAAVFSATCGGGVDHVGSCGDTSVGNFLARLGGAGVDWLSMPKRFAEQARSGNGVPSLEVTAKTVALGIEEWKVGAVRKTVGNGVGTLWRLKFSSQPQPKNGE